MLLSLYTRYRNICRTERTISPDSTIPSQVRVLNPKRAFSLCDYSPVSANLSHPDNFSQCNTARVARFYSQESAWPPSANKTNRLIVGERHAHYRSLGFPKEKSRRVIGNVQVAAVQARNACRSKYRALKHARFWISKRLAPRQWHYVTMPWHICVVHTVLLISGEIGRRTRKAAMYLA